MQRDEQAPEAKEGFGLGCPVQRTTWAARFNLEPGQAVTGPCAQKGGERLGIQKYDDPATSEDQLVIKSLALAALDADDPVNPSDAACTEPGHGLNPEFASVCDPTQLRCIPERRPPSLRM